MYQSLLNFLRGNIWAEVTCAMPERFFNLCGAHGIPFWSVEWHDATTFSLRTTRWGYFRLKSVTGELDATITLRREKGAPVVLRRFRRRYVILAAGVLFALLIWWGNTYIWAFEVTGNETVPTEQILRALERQGVKVGTRSLSVDQEDLRNHILLELKDISWLAVNISGCTAHVQVVERHRPPKLLKDSEKCNIVAAKSGLITKVEAWDGQAAVLPGCTVTRGQLLISGVVDSDMTGVRLLHSLGKVYARTWYDMSVAVPLEIRQNETIKKQSTHLAVIFGKNRINFWGKGSVLGQECDKIIRYNSIRLPFGLGLPVTLQTERVSSNETATILRTAAQARQEGEQVLLQELQSRLPEDSEVITTRFSAAEKNGYLLVTLQAECLEQIGQSVPIEF